MFGNGERGGERDGNNSLGKCVCICCREEGRKKKRRGGGGEEKGIGSQIIKRGREVVVCVCVCGGVRWE